MSTLRHGLGKELCYMDEVLKKQYKPTNKDEIQTRSDRIQNPAVDCLCTQSKLLQNHVITLVFSV